MKLLVVYLALLSSATYAVARPIGSRNEPRPSTSSSSSADNQPIEFDKDEDNESEDELILYNEVDPIPTDDCIIFAEPITVTETRKILLQALELINLDPTTKGISSQRIKESKERSLARKVILAMNMHSEYGIDCGTLPTSLMRDEDFTLDDLDGRGQKRKVKESTIDIILKMVDEKKSLASIQAKYAWYQRSHATVFRLHKSSRGSHKWKLCQIDTHVWRKFIEARQKDKGVHQWTLRDWAREKAADLQVSSQFTASSWWIHDFKTRHGIVSRKITKYTSRAQRDQEEADLLNIDKFHDLYKHLSKKFPKTAIINMDQVPFNYELVNERTLSHQGERDTYIDVDSHNKMTHSYTTMPIISRAGNSVGKLLICFQEVGGNFGPKVKETVRGLEKKYKNIAAFASSSGKMTSELMKRWKREVLYPGIDLEATEQAESNTSNSELIEKKRTWWETVEELDSEEFPPAKVLLLMDTWSGQQNIKFVSRLRQDGVQVLSIPPRVTSQLQPLDVAFNRQYKKFVKRIAEILDLQGRKDLLTTREGIMNFQSLVYNQFSAPSYQDLLLYSWYKTDSNFREDELFGSSKSLINKVTENSFDLDPDQTCGVEFCAKKSHIKCAYCGKHLCMDHFLSRTCFHDPMGNPTPQDLTRPYRHDFLMHIDYTFRSPNTTTQEHSVSNCSINQSGEL